MRSDLQGGLTTTLTGMQLSNILKIDDFLLGIVNGKRLLNRMSSFDTLPEVNSYRKVEK